MQQFKEFRGRRVILKRSSWSELDNYKKQVDLYSKEDDKLNIIKGEKTGYITIMDESSRIIGLFQIDEIDENVACVKPSIPNQVWEERYGREAIHQFLKCCIERKLYKRVYFKPTNNIVRSYKKERPKMLNENFYIDIKID